MSMSTLEDVPFQTLLGPLEEEVQLVTAPDITVPDCQQILQDNEVTHASELLKFLFFSFSVDQISGINSLAVICLSQSVRRSNVIMLILLVTGQLNSWE